MPHRNVNVLFKSEKEKMRPGKEKKMNEDDVDHQLNEERYEIK
jgi:hypothetical protein